MAHRYYDTVTGLTTTGDVWSFITYSGAIVEPRPFDYDPTLIWDTATSSWVTNYSVAGGGRWKENLIIIGHKKLYFLMGAEL